MSERCDRCGRVMAEADFDAEHSTVHVGTSGTIDGHMYFGDSWHLLCHECHEAFKPWFRRFMDMGKRPIEDMDFSVRTYNCLMRAGIRTVEQLQRMDDAELLAIRGFGQNQLDEVREGLEAMR